ncbi:MAG: DUF6941 family protein [Chloroflexota bacterium]
MSDEDTSGAGGQSVDQLPEIRTFMLADRAEVLQGKLYIMGGSLDIFLATGFPTAITFGIALVVAIPWNHTNEEIALSVVFEDADGQVLGRMDAPITVGRPPNLGKGDEQLVPLAVSNLTFAISKAGAFVALSSLNGKPGPRATFRVQSMGTEHRVPQ